MEKFNFYAIKLCGIMIALFSIQFFVRSFTDLFLLNQESFTEVWRFITSIFLHGSISHLFYNLFALALFGSILEKLVGGKKFLMIFFVTGILANIISINFYEASLGASGAIFGIIGALIFIKPMLPIWAFGLPMPIFLAGIMWAIGDIIGIFIPGNTANIAHLSGMFFGLIFGKIYKKNKKKTKKQKTILDEDSIRNWENSWM